MADEVMATDEQHGIFEGERFYIVGPNTDLTYDKIEQLEQLLIDNGAVESEQGNGQIDDLEGLTYIISTSADFPAYDEAIDKFIKVVKPAWVTQSIDKKKQADPLTFSPDPRLIMSEAIVACAGIPEGDAEAIAGGVVAMGGRYSEKLTRLVTHLVALDEGSPEVQMVRMKGLACHVVLPHWFDDCLRLGRKISEVPYLLPDPEILKLEHTALPTPRNSTDIDGALSAKVDHDALRQAAQNRPIKVLKGKTITLGEDLNLAPNLYMAISGLIIASGGMVADDIDEADTLICKYRDGHQYVSASQAKLIVGNLAWFYDIAIKDRWTSPLKKPLHYPIPRGGIPGFEKTLISISNYTGSVRLYLQALVEALGGNFSKMMTQEATHLVVAHLGGEKCEAAKEWNIEVVNHLWLEDSYMKCEMQRMTNPRYSHFPLRTNLGEIVGQTQLDRGILEKKYFPKKRVSRSPVKSTIEDADDLPTEDDMDVDDPIPAPVAKPEKKKKGRANPTNLTPATRRVLAEDHTPSTTSSRGAKDRAVSKLQDNAADIALYEKEKKRVGGVTHGRSRGDRANRDRDSNSAETEQTRGSKRKSVDRDDENGEQEDDDVSMADAAEPKAKKVKKTKADKLPPITHRIMITFWQRWVKNPDSVSADKNTLRNLGMHITEDFSQINILFAPRIVKTKKFICAMANAPHILNTDFLDYCIKHNKLPSISSYVLSDREGEDKLNCNLLRTLERAERNAHHLLKGWQIFCTKDIAGGFDTYKEIVKTNGGECFMYTGRNAMTVSKRTFDKSLPAAESQNDDKGDVLYLISGGSKDEMSLWKKFRELAKKADMQAKIVQAEWILSCTLNQEIRWMPKWEWGESEPS